MRTVPFGDLILVSLDLVLSAVLEAVLVLGPYVFGGPLLLGLAVQLALLNLERRSKFVGDVFTDGLIMLLPGAVSGFASRNLAFSIAISKSKAVLTFNSSELAELAVPTIGSSESSRSSSRFQNVTKFT